MVVETNVEMEARREAMPLQRPRPLPARGDATELVAHEAFIEKLGENSIWKDYAAAQ